MKITILAVGKIKERYLREAVQEYSKRLSRYCRLEIIEVEDERTPDRAGEREEELIRSREAGRLMRYLGGGAYVIALDINGTARSSEEFAERIDKLGVEGKSHIIFVIGGSIGLAPEISGRADERLSFSKMTFPHPLMRVILLEQIYRAYRIVRGEPYHK